MGFKLTILQLQEANVCKGKGLKLFEELCHIQGSKDTYEFHGTWTPYAEVCASLFIPEFVEWLRDKKRKLIPEPPSLEGVQLSGANLSFGNFFGRDFRKANLSEAKIVRANFSSTNLREANLSGAYCVRSDFAGADMKEANLEGTCFDHSNLGAVVFTGAKRLSTDSLIPGWKLETGRMVKDLELKCPCSNPPHPI